MDINEATYAKMAAGHSNSAAPKQPTFFEQLSTRLDRISQTLAEADGTLGALSDRLFSGTVADRNAGSQNAAARSEPGFAERVLLALEIL